MKIQVGDTTFTATLAENSSVDALKELMTDGPLILNMSDYANMEKGADLGVTLPQNNEQMNTQAGSFASCVHCGFIQIRKSVIDLDVICIGRNSGDLIWYVSLEKRVRKSIGAFGTDKSD